MSDNRLLVEAPVILSIGEVLWDLFPTGERFGGAPANFACHAAILGADVILVSAVGDDLRGSQAIEILRENKIDVGLIQTTADTPTGTVGVEVDQHGKPTYVIHGPSAWDGISCTTELEARIPSVCAVYFGTLGQRDKVSRETVRKVVSIAAETGIPRVLDVNLRPPFCDPELIRDSVQLASILKLSDEELAAVCLACDVELHDQPDLMLGRLREAWDLDLVVMTKGADGAVLLSAEEKIEQDGIAANVVDTVGAGDSFAASFLLGELAGKPRQENLRESCRVAAATCGHAGAIPSVRNDNSQY